MSFWVATAANAGTAMPRSAISFFSASRSCATSRIFGSGRTGTRLARNRALATGTFSNSNVTTSTAPAKAASAASSS